MSEEKKIEIPVPNIGPNIGLLKSLTITGASAGSKVLIHDMPFDTITRTIDGVNTIILDFTEWIQRIYVKEYYRRACQQAVENITTHHPIEFEIIPKVLAASNLTCSEVFFNAHQ